MFHETTNSVRAEPYTGTMLQFEKLDELLNNDQSNVLGYLRKNNIPVNTNFTVSVPQSATSAVDVRFSLLQTMLSYQYMEGVRFLIEQDKTLLSANHELLNPLTKEISTLPILGFLVNNASTEILTYLIEQGADVSAECETVYGVSEAWQLFALSGDLKNLRVILELKPDINLENKIGNYTVFDILKAQDPGVRSHLDKCYQTIRASKSEMVTELKAPLALLKRLGLPVPPIKWFPSMHDVYQQVVVAYSTLLDNEKSNLKKYQSTLSGYKNSSMSVVMRRFNPNGAAKAEAQIKQSEVLIKIFEAVIKANKALLPMCYLLKCLPTSEQNECLTMLREHRAKPSAGEYSVSEVGSKLMFWPEKSEQDDADQKDTTRCCTLS